MRSCFMSSKGKMNQEAMPNYKIRNRVTLELRNEKRVYTYWSGLILAFLGNGGKKAASIMSLR